MMSAGAISQPYDLSFKVALVGDSNVGKTALLCYEEAANRVGQDKNYGRKEESGASIDLNIKTLPYECKDFKCLVQYWDCPGAERYMQLTSRYCVGVAAVIFVFDVFNRSTFDRVENWLTHVQKHNTDFIKILVGNRTTVSANQVGGNSNRAREVPLKRAETFAAEHGMDYFETNTSSGARCQAVFENVLTRVMDSIPIPPEPSLLLGRGIKLGPKLVHDKRYKNALCALAKSKSRETPMMRFGRERI